MATYSTNEFRPGLKLLLNGDPYNILENEFVKPGKGQAFNRVKMRNLKTGRILDKTFRSGENVEAADVLEVNMQYLYNDSDQWHFMHPENFEQFVVDKKVMGSSADWMKEQEMYTVVLWNNAPLTIEAPNTLKLKVAETDPGMRGDTATGGSKPATMESGAVVKVPLFIEEGEIILVDTRTGEYLSRSK